MNEPVSRQEGLADQVKTGMAVGFCFFQLFGFLNALVVVGSEAVWFKQFVQGGEIPPGAREFLLRFTPIFGISALSNGLLGLLIGGVWGAVVGGVLKLRGRFPDNPVERISLSIASFFAFPFVLVTVLSIVILQYALDKGSVALGVGKVAANVALLLVGSYVFFRVLRFFLRHLFRVSLFRYPITRRGFVTLTLCYGLFIGLLSTVPPMLVSPKRGDALPFACGPADGTPAQRPNILLVVLDTTRADHLSCYGYPKPTTPSIDRMAAEGVLFENAYSAAVWTLAGHASIFTGMTPSKNGANGENIYLDEGFITLAEILAHCGYRTAGFCNNPWVSDFTAMDQGFQHYRKMWLKPYGQNLILAHGVYRLIQRLFTYVPPVGSVEATTEEAQAWMRKRQEGPFFVFINLMEPHPPLDYRPEFTDPFLPAGLSPDDLKAVNQNPYSLWAGKEKMEEKDFQAYRALYDGELRYMDFHLGRFFDRMQAEGLLDNTLLVITADHGEQMGEGGFLGHHFSLREALIHVPLILRGPAWVPQGVRVAAKVQTLDILPTVLGLLGIQDVGLWQALQGKSLLPLPGGGERSIVAEEFRPLLEMKFVDAFQPSFDVDDVYGHRSRAWVEETYKYVAQEEGAESIYDLSRDPREVDNLAESRPDLLERMRGDLVRWMSSFEPFDVRQENFRFQPDKSTEDQLRSLGYVQ